MSTSILDKLCGQLCAEVSGRADTKDILARLESQNLIIFPLDNRRHWYRYHQLFSDFLSQGLVDLRPDDVPFLNLKAAQWWSSEGMPAEVIDHALQARDYNFALALIDNESTDKLAKGEVLTLVRWVESIPEDLVREHPGVLLNYNWALIIAGQVNWEDAASLIDGIAVGFDIEIEGIGYKLDSPGLNPVYRVSCAPSPNY